MTATAYERPCFSRDVRLNVCGAITLRGYPLNQKWHIIRINAFPAENASPFVKITLTLYLTTGTPLIKGFVSRKSGKAFDAYLKLEDGKAVFEFQ